MGADPYRDVDVWTTRAGRRDRKAAPPLRTAPSQPEPYSLESVPNGGIRELRAIWNLILLQSFIFWEPEWFLGMATIVSEPDEMIGVLSHIPYHQQEVSWVLSNTLTKGQALSAHMEPGGEKIKEIKQNLVICIMKFKILLLATYKRGILGVFFSM